MKTTQRRHAQRIQRVIDYIHGNCAEDIDSNAVAEIAQLSTYHWHRIYMAVTGESAVSTLRRVRLEKSATALLRDDKPISQIASDAGFDNLQAFTRLFSRTYGLPPGKFRSNHSAAASATASSSLEAQAARPEAQHLQLDKPVSNKPEFTQEVDIAERNSLHLVGLWHSGDYNEIVRVFEKIMAAAEIESWPRSDAFTVGIYHDDPDVVPLDQCRSFAGIPVSREFQAPDAYDTQELPGGLHASCLHTGPYALLPESYRWLYREWLRGSTHYARDEPCHEIYLNTPYNTLPAQLQTLICMPLEDHQ